MLDIGLDQEYIQQTATNFELFGAERARIIYKPRSRFTHKGHYGHSLIIGGSYGKIGAVALTAKACLHSGSGLVTVYVPGCGYNAIQASLPEIMVMTNTHEKEITEIALDWSPSAIGIGIGMGTSAQSTAALTKFLDRNRSAMVIDADGLNILAQKKSLLEKLSPKTVLTPHPKELERLVGPWKNDFEKLEKAMTFSKKYDCIMVLKDAYSITVYKDKGYVNNSGNQGMATAGCGDVLTGLICGLIAQGYEALEASVLGVYLHGLSGDLASKTMGFEALTASAIIEHIGKGYLHILQPPAMKTASEPGEQTS